MNRHPLFHLGQAILLAFLIAVCGAVAGAWLGFIGAIAVRVGRWFL